MSMIGKSIGHIRIEGMVGRGGMGEVYRGYDVTLQRKVAIKAIVPTQHLTPDRKARFLREARALSRLEHPNICKIFDFIESEGADLLVLEFIEGRTLGQAIESGIDKPDKLRIARDIAQVLAVAHGKGIVHRDLKPANIKLTPEGQVKVLDFGLARFLGPAPAVTSGPAAEVGEEKNGGEADAEEEDRPTAPLPPEPLACRTITIGGGSGPSTGTSDILSDSAPTEQGTVMGTPQYMSPEQARGDRTTPASDMYSFGLILQELFTGLSPYEDTDDPSTLLAWAIKGETRPVTGLSSDLTALIDRLKSPVPTARPTAVEAVERIDRIREKPKRRLRRGIVAGIATAFVLAGVKYTLDVRRERDRANQEAEVSRQVSDFLTGLFKVSDPSEARGNSVTAREILDKGADKIATELQGQPLIQAKLMNTMGRVYQSLGLYQRAGLLLEKALETARANLGNEHPEIASYQLALAWLYNSQGKENEAISMCRSALAILEKTAGPESTDVARALHTLAVLLRDKGEYGEARTLFEKSRAIYEKALGPDTMQVAYSYYHQGWLSKLTGNLAEAKQSYERALSIEKKILPPDHPDLAWCLNDLSIVYENMGDYDGSRQFLEQSLAIQEKVFGPNHPAVAAGLKNLGVLLWRIGKYDQAKPLYERALSIEEKALGPEHGEVAGTLNNLALLADSTGNYVEAQRLYERSLSLTEKFYGPEHAEVAISQSNLAQFFEKMGEQSRAIALYEKSLAVLEKVFGVDHPEVATALRSLAAIYCKRGDYALAEPLFRRSLAIYEKAAEPDDLERAATMEEYAVALRKTGHSGEAEKLETQAQLIRERSIKNNPQK
jgi:eukaryotic-like serine/threonine-protein kinase